MTRHLLGALAVVLLLLWGLGAQASPPADAPLAQPAPPRSCPDCEVEPRPWRAFGELMLTQAIPSSFNIIVQDAEWAKISPASWATNVENPWQWDNNQFINNQFSHPYHGSLYFNSARANGYNFWQSAPWAFGGSLMWELFAETWAPSPNDFWNTSLGGITLGETLWRLSSLVLDNRVTGRERVAREVGAAVINPVRGFNRLVDGHAWRVAENPAEFRPGRVFAMLDLGYGHTVGTTTDQVQSELGHAYFAGELVYGDPVSDLDGAPFSTFDLRLGLMSRQAEGTRRFTQLQSRGNLGAKQLRRSEGTEHQLAAFITYDFFASPSLEFGGQGFALGPVSRWGLPAGFRLEAELLATPMPISAVRSDYFVTEEGRDYDYGVGMGGRAELRASWANRALLRATGRYLWQPVLSGFNGDHQQLGLQLEGRFFVIGQVGLGAIFTWYQRDSRYDAFADVSQTGRQFRIFASLAGPRWTP
ncbi:DUF3943 domain-containing protein [Pyxidicoccus trucidator]|uniref:DUF3943 domain-containing protein n=1 Tax=Pyxidicoccus trucidator TaxID=2709662 RepID=UPI0013DCC31C|nr:DUF3943 domain-containing protein [Pyxidicoccus trucidator]